MSNTAARTHQHLALWAELRSKVSLADVADMLRQDMEADGLDTEEIESVVAGLQEAEADTVAQLSVFLNPRTASR